MHRRHGCMSQFAATVFATLALLSAHNVSADSGFCYDKRLAISDAQRQGCRSHQIKLREGGTIVPAQLAQVIVGTRRQGRDYLTSLNHYFLLLPDDRILAMGEFLPWEDPMVDYWWKQELGFSVERRAEVRQLIGFGPISYSRVYEAQVEKRGETYCLLRSFKYPFTGETRDCLGNRKPAEGSVGYAAGTIRVDQVWKLACARAVSGTKQTCGIGGIQELQTSLERDEAGSLNYNVVLGRTDGSYLAYRVGANTADVTLLGQGPSTAELNKYW